MVVASLLGMKAGVLLKLTYLHLWLDNPHSAVLCSEELLQLPPSTSVNTCRYGIVRYYSCLLLTMASAMFPLVTGTWWWVITWRFCVVWAESTRRRWRSNQTQLLLYELGRTRCGAELSSRIPATLSPQTAVQVLLS